MFREISSISYLQSSRQPTTINLESSRTRQSAIPIPKTRPRKQSFSKLNAVHFCNSIIVHFSWMKEPVCPMSMPSVYVSDFQTQEVMPLSLFAFTRRGVMHIRPAMIHNFKFSLS